MCVPVELQQNTPRKIRLAARGLYYLIGSTLVSIVLLACAVGLSIHDAKLVKRGNELTRDGHLTYTNDVQIGGPRQATVYYSFTYNGENYHGDAFLPKERVAQVEQYCKSGSFPILFLPNDPSVNHPYDWHDTQSVPLLKLFFALLVIVQWSVLFRFILQDLRLVRSGKVAVGKVTSCRFSRNGGFLLEYKFCDMDDLLTEGKGEYPVPKKKGEEICVLYPPAETTKSRPYPLVFFRAVK
jgi:hypothetical protein